MNKPKLLVRNFGPIKEGLGNDGWISFPKVTLFCGPQGSGKSSITKLFSLLSWIEKTAARDLSVQIDIQMFVEALLWQGIESFVSASTEIHYVGSLLDFHFVNGNVSATMNFDDRNKYIMPKISYMPAERNFTTIIRKANRVENLPSPLVDMQVEFANAQKRYSSGYHLPANGFRFMMDSEGSWIVNGDDADANKTRLEHASSGLQSMVPLLLVPEYLSETLDGEAPGQDILLSIRNQGTAERRLALEAKVMEILSDSTLTQQQRYSRIHQLLERGHRFLNIVEEPEQNLYPETQCDVLNRLIAISNKKPESQLVLSTHSPYVVNHLILVAQAAELMKDDRIDPVARAKASLIVPSEATIPGEEIAIYEMSEGSIKLIEPVDGMPSDENPMNRILQSFNAKYADLIELMG